MCSALGQDAILDLALYKFGIFIYFIQANVKANEARWDSRKTCPQNCNGAEIQMEFE